METEIVRNIAIGFSLSATQADRERTIIATGFYDETRIIIRDPKLTNQLTKAALFIPVLALSGVSTCVAMRSPRWGRRHKQVSQAYFVAFALTSRYFNGRDTRRDSAAQNTRRPPLEMSESLSS